MRTVNFHAAITEVPDCKRTSQRPRVRVLKFIRKKPSPLSQAEASNCTMYITSLFSFCLLAVGRKTGWSRTKDDLQGSLRSFLDPFLDARSLANPLIMLFYCWEFIKGVFCHHANNKAHIEDTNIGIGHLKWQEEANGMYLVAINEDKRALLMRTEGLLHADDQETNLTYLHELNLPGPANVWGKECIYTQVFFFNLSYNDVASKQLCMGAKDSCFFFVSTNCEIQFVISFLICQ